VSTWDRFVPRRGTLKELQEDAEALRKQVKREAEIYRKAHMLEDQKSALDMQIGGNHYKGFKIQPVEFIHKNNIGFCEGSAIKYLCRWRDKGGIADLEKAKHFIDMLIDLEK